MMNAPRQFSRRDFLAVSALAAASATTGLAATAPTEPIIDIHQHLNYGGKRDKSFNQISPGRSDAQFIQHQHNMGVTQTILLPAGRSVLRSSTHFGSANGLETTCSGNDACEAFAKAHRGKYFFGANEVPDLEDAPEVIERYLKRGAIVIGEQKFGVECDSPQMEALYRLAADYKVPILMHWQYGTYNYGYDRFDKVLARFPSTTFIGHAQTVWANIDKNNVNDFAHLYPTGKVTLGGLTDRYLSNFPNFYADLSAGSGNNAFTRDPEQATGFITRHQDKLLYGSDCSDVVGHGAICSGFMQIQAVRQMSPSKSIERKLLYGNAKGLFRI